MHASLAPKPPSNLPNGAGILVRAPRQNLEELDLSEELYKQYVKVKDMFDAAPNEPLNQRAQTINSIVAVLGRITQIRTELYSAERLKKMEECLIRTLKLFPDISESFLAAYEEALDAS